LQSFEERFEIGLRQTIELVGGQSLAVHVSAGALLYQRVGDETVDVAAVGSSLSFDPGAESSETGGFAKAGLSVVLAPGVSAFGEAEALWTDEVESYTGSGGLRLRF
jgi:hypothetical protein